MALTCVRVATLLHEKNTKSDVIRRGHEEVFVVRIVKIIILLF